MSDIQRTSIGYLSPVGDYGLRNSQALSGVSHLWQDFFARAMAEQVGDAPKQASVELPVDGPVEPTAGAEMLAQIVDQRHCDVTDTPVRPPEPLFLPIAEFELDLLKKPAPPYPDDEIVAQQQQQDFESGWVRPIVLTAGQPLPDPGTGPQPRPLHLPIAEFELDLLEKPAVPFDEQTLAQQQKAMDYDLLWARPLVAHNLRLAA
ncbi:energy transducer TonB [Pseudomonas gingeri]|uniref:Energy transducer TonB n=1 Tax=Pseudomonas gingeri TaxID=117681 RepID=A0A7Y8CIR9_9PSED|nr:energy transducer TonB [Pseudomonas gingeri]NWA03155.1 energy transducer TonB [Pseudomonas gingeri]NWA18377.1 energy transducer TonB [Pseudomonas gingeri]NWA53196.1 energy transducer TonB [Pseudomonas gingeri]NWA98988.1 energy transducer TonB [Pseudomonas gingeri]NWB02322.1 energy transducer TonB [Pseudomonas gingeri]